MRFFPLVVASLGLASTAGADPYSLGVRVGGYGFHREGSNEWDVCRMNGLGVFGNHKLRGPLFVEAGLDTYVSQPQAEATDMPIDRQSAIVSLAAGARTSFTPWLHGYAQLGLGAELTRVAVPYGDGTTIRDDKVMPAGFVGFGADIRVGSATYLGAQVRTMVMGNFNYDPARLQMSNQWVAAPSASDVFSASPDLAAQGQFYLRHDL
jgi:hypothetical protein